MSARLPRFTRVLLPILVLVFLAALLYEPLRFRFLSDEEKIAHAVHGIVDAARARHIRDLLEWVSEAYQDRFHPDKAALQANLQGMWFRFRKVRVDLAGESRITLDPAAPDRALAVFEAKVLLGMSPDEDPTNDLVGRLRGTERFCLHFRREGSVWRVTGCTETETPR